MRIIRSLLFLLALLYCSLGLATAGVTLSPKSGSVAIGNTLQFSVSGVAAGTYVWYAGGVAGGNATAGTINASGLYTAPAALPAQNPVQISIHSAANSKTVLTSVYVNLLGSGPSITSVTPNPLTVGTINVTINGSGFQTGAEVLVSYGSNTNIQLSTTQVTPTQVQAQGYVGPAASATFCVTNPGSVCSNSVTVPVQTPYSLTVSNGSGSGTYTAGQAVTITANTPPAGEIFAAWKGAAVTSGAVANATSSTTTLTMPAGDTSLKATYVATAPPKYTLTVTNGSGSGSYAAGTVVTIAANAPASGNTFANWTGATVANSANATTTLTMPAANAAVTANYAATPTYLLSINNGTISGGTGSGYYAAGTVVTIIANAPTAGNTFANWTGASVGNAASATTTLTMPASGTTVTANYAAGPTYSLSVTSGSGSGTYAANTVVTIVANAAPAGSTFADWTGAAVANATNATTTLTMPAANASVTANYASTPIVTGTTYNLNVNNGSGSGSYSAGQQVTIVANPAPTGANFVSWLGATFPGEIDVLTNQSATLTMPAANVNITAVFGGAPVALPFPVTDHPRLWINSSDLPKLQSWATGSNPIYTQGMVPLLAQAVSYYNTYYFPNGVANSVYPDNGDSQGYGTYASNSDGTTTWVPISEQLAEIFAFNSLIDPNPGKRILYAQYARNLIMYAINQAAAAINPVNGGHVIGAPFQDPGFAIYNRANGSGEQWALTVDWIYNTVDANHNPILTATDKATIRNVFMLWANDCLNASTTGGDHPDPVAVTNNAQLFPNNLPYRMASNNYYLGHARLLTMMALVMDPSDDPAVDPTQPTSNLGNSLRSFLTDANGAWLYQEYAMYGEAQSVANDYGIGGNGAGFGLASGGLPPEGSLYGHSHGFVLGQLLALQTAGFNNVNFTGPQIKLIGAPMWNRFVTGYISSLTPTSSTYSAWAPPGQSTQDYSFMGPVYQFAGYGDMLRTWVTPDGIEPFTLLELLQAKSSGYNGNLNAARWFAINALEGGPSFLMTRINSPWAYSTQSSVLYYLLFDPTDPSSATPTDPRLSFPTTPFVDPAAGRVVAHSDWTPTGTMFSYRASWESINHQHGDAGQFELLRNGEWLTKEMSNYDNNNLGQTSMYNNGLGLQNWVSGTPNLAWYEAGMWSTGSQWILGDNAGDPTTVTSSGPGYVYAMSNMTPLYNQMPDQWAPTVPASDIQQATRSIVWLNNDYIITYDRATSIHPGLFKTFNLNMATTPVISGNTATETLASGQQLFVQTLLPQTPALSYVNGAANLNSVAILEQMQYILTVQDPSLPTDTRFLHVLQGADAGTAMVPAVHLSSISGTAFDGASFGNKVVYFPVANSNSLQNTLLPAPSGVNTVLVTGLVANATYAVSVTANQNGTGNIVSIAPAASGTTADSAGLLWISF